MSQKLKNTNFINHPFDPIKKIRIIFEGLFFVLSHDFSVTYKCVISIIAVGASLYYRTVVDVMLVIIVSIVMICFEMMNSCFELVCDFYTKEYNREIKMIKDAAAATAGLAILLWIIVLGYELIEVIQLIW